MQFSELTIKLIILFLPGLISASLLQMFENGGKKLGNREFLILVVVNSFISYLIPCLFCGNNTFFKSLLDTSVIIDYKEVLCSSIISVGLGVIETYFVNYCILFSGGFTAPTASALSKIDPASASCPRTAQRSVSQ